MRVDFPRISVTDPKAYKAIWRAANREKLRVYMREYQRKRRAKIKRQAKQAAKVTSGRKKYGRQA